MITSNELRQKYLDFFKSKNHAIISSASLIPENDPTVLFTTAGMHPLVPYLLGERHPEGTRLSDVQKCVRMQDIEEVGDERHDTFFEMLGNWSLGAPEKPNGLGAGYFKKESIAWSYEFLTDPKWLGLDKRKIAVTVFEGDNDASRDEESANYWQEVGMSENRIGYLPKKNNWWGPAGITGPCGPDTEIFWWKGETEFPPENSNPANDEDNWLEIWNNVFMQYNKVKAKSEKEKINEINEEFIYEPLAQKNVDTGMGLERTLMVLNGLSDTFQVDTFWPLILKIEEISGQEYSNGGETTKSMRIIADHVRTATMIMGDDKGISPSNTDQGYIVRRLIRRAIRHGKVLGIKENFCSKIAEEVIKIFADVYKEVQRNKDFVLTEIGKEESKFRNTLEAGMKKFEEEIKNKKFKEISATQAFDLYQSYGFPLEMTIELAKENNLEIDVVGFNEEMKKHQELSRSGAEQKFKGGLADQGEMSVKYHTATHLLHSALRKVLGEHVAQKGSNITAERMRFDFSHPEKMTSEQIKQVEDLVNEAIKADYKVTCEETTVEDARSKGAIGLFGDKYGEKVKVYTIGDPSASSGQDFSREICGGPHVEHTGLLGKFRISKEEASSAGVRRIKAILE